MGKEIKIAIFSRVVSTEGRKFTSYSTKYAFKDEEGKRIVRYITVKFNNDAFNDSAVPQKDIKRGYLYVDSEFVSCPDKYEITVDEKTGKKKYPTCWIKGGIRKYEEVLKEHEFHFDTNLENEDIAEEGELPADE